MDIQKQREIARKGGESVPAEKRSFSQNHALAAEAGRKGGQASQGGRSSRQNADAGVNGSPLNADNTGKVHESERASSAVEEDERR